jgi:hypothetical protein
MPPQDQDPLQKEIDEIKEFPSERPTPVEMHFDFNNQKASSAKSLRPKIPDGWPARIVAIIIACGTIAEVIHQVWAAR